jgi:hypothetical protein
MGEFIINKTALIAFAVIVFLLGGIGTAFYLFSPSNGPTASNSELNGLAQASSNGQVLGDETCAAPATVQGVKVEYPGCSVADPNNCDLAQASCKWDPSSDAASYNVTVTELETGKVVLNNQSEPLSTNKILFPITQKMTYKCDVTAVATCGTVSAAASDQLLCETDAILDTPTIAPTTSAPTLPPPTPTIANPGGETQTIAILGVVAAALVGGFVLLLL